MVREDESRYLLYEEVPNHHLTLDMRNEGLGGEGGCKEAGVQGSEVRGRAREGSLCLQPWLRDLHSLHSQSPKANGVLSREACVSLGRKWRQGRGWSGGASTHKEATVMRLGETSQGKS